MRRDDGRTAPGSNRRDLVGFWGACLTVLSFTACTGVQTVHPYRAGRALESPARVVVKDFAYAPDDGSLSSGMGARIVSGADKTPKTAEERALGRTVAEALSRKLVEKLLDLGLNAQRFDGQYPPFDNIVVVEGQFTSIDEGNRVARTVVGFGFGRSEVRTHAQVYQHDGSRRTLLQNFTTVATSSFKPGVVPALGIGAAAGTVATAAAVSGGAAVASETLSATVEAGAERTAAELAARMKPLFIAQAWIPAYDDR